MFSLQSLGAMVCGASQRQRMATQQQQANVTAAQWANQQAAAKTPVPVKLTPEDEIAYTKYRDEAMAEYYDKPENAVKLFVLGYSKEDFVEKGIQYLFENINELFIWNKAYQAKITDYTQAKSVALNPSIMNKAALAAYSQRSLAANLTNQPWATYATSAQAGPSQQSALNNTLGGV